MPCRTGMCMFAMVSGGGAITITDTVIGQEGTDDQLAVA